jgi:uncharacterized protein
MTSFDLRRLKLRSGEEYRDEVDVELAPLEFGGQRYLPVPETVPAELTVDRATTGTVFRLRFRARPESDDMTTPYLADDRLDLSAWAHDSVVLALPDQILCREDCAGLCPTCGKNLNEEPHEHEEEGGDPRWDALSQLRDRL